MTPPTLQKAVLADRPVGLLDATVATVADFPAVDDGTVDLARDRDLVRRCQEGDRSAFDELYRRYHARLVRFCRRRLGEEHEAQDAAQEAFAKAWRALPTFAGQRRFYPWLTVIAGNVCTDVLRRRSRLTLVDEVASADLDRSSATDDGVEHRMVDAVDASMAVQALGQLSERHQRVLSLREGSGWSTKRIADHEGVTVPVAETLLWRARRALQREFAALADTGGRLGAGLLGAGLALRRLLARGRRAVIRPVARLEAWHPVRLVSSAGANQTALTGSLGNLPLVSAVGAVAMAGGLFLVGTQLATVGASHARSAGTAGASGGAGGATSSIANGSGNGEASGRGAGNGSGDGVRGPTTSDGAGGGASGRPGSSPGAPANDHGGAAGGGGVSPASGSSVPGVTPSSSGTAAPGGSGGGSASGGTAPGSSFSSPGGDGGGVGSTVGSVGSGVGSTVGSVGSGVGSTVGSVGSGIGSTVGSVGSGAGAAASGAGSGLGGSVDGLGGHL